MHHRQKDESFASRLIDVLNDIIFAVNFLKQTTRTLENWQEVYSTRIKEGMKIVKTIVALWRNKVRYRRLRQYIVGMWAKFYKNQ